MELPNRWRGPGEEMTVSTDAVIGIRMIMPLALITGLGIHGLTRCLGLSRVEKGYKRRGPGI
ncbi:MAG: hypothetical protein ACP5NQ_08155 [Vulcanisaeta sp.]